MRARPWSRCSRSREYELRADLDRRLRKIEGSTVLVTGGTGSVGSPMVRHLLSKGVSEVRVLSRDEAKQDAMRHDSQDARVRFYLGDTRDSGTIDSAMSGVDFVFHAAALKQVPSSEFFPLEAVKTNVLGSSNVITSALNHEVKALVCLSTDKAVYPINAMGMSKALMEKTAMAHARLSAGTKTAISVTRYGNVMFSRGSVIPLFIQQIKSNLPITITDPLMTRFLMTLEESVELVEYALQHGQGGELFVKKAPATNIGTLAKAITELFQLPKDYPVKAIGFRHGEKLFESLLSSEESAIAKDIGNFYSVPLDDRALDYSLYFEKGHKESLGLHSAYTSHSTQQLSLEEVKDLLLSQPYIRRELGL